MHRRLLLLRNNNGVSFYDRNGFVTKKAKMNFETLQKPSKKAKDKKKNMTH